MQMSPFNIIAYYFVCIICGLLQWTGLELALYFFTLSSYFIQVMYCIVLFLIAVFTLPLFPEPIMKIHVCCSKLFLVLYSDDKVERFI